MIGFIIGTIFGGCVGVVWMCLCRAAGDADNPMEKAENNDDH